MKGLLLLSIFLPTMSLSKKVAKECKKGPPEKLRTVELKTGDQVYNVKAPDCNIKLKHGFSNFMTLCIDGPQPVYNVRLSLVQDKTAMWERSYVVFGCLYYDFNPLRNSQGKLFQLVVFDACNNTVTFQCTLSLQVVPRDEDLGQLRTGSSMDSKPLISFELAIIILVLLFIGGVTMGVIGMTACHGRRERTFKPLEPKKVAFVTEITTVECIATESVEAYSPSMDKDTIVRPQLRQ